MKGAISVILYILLNNERVTAPELAEEFGVSVRTIYRDIDTMSAAGIPSTCREAVRAVSIFWRDIG